MNRTAISASRGWLNTQKVVGFLWGGLTCVACVTILLSFLIIPGSFSLTGLLITIPFLFVGSSVLYSSITLKMIWIDLEGVHTSNTSVPWLNVDKIILKCGKSLKVYVFYTINGSGLQLKTTSYATKKKHVNNLSSLIVETWSASTQKPIKSQTEWPMKILILPGRGALTPELASP